MKKIYHRIIQISGNVITVEADNVANGELAEVKSPRGTSLAQVIRLDKTRVYLQVFAGSRGISTDSEVRFLGQPMRVSASDALLGRIFTGNGSPRDKGPALTDNMIDIGGPSVNPANRVIPKNMIRTGLPMIDIFNTLVESQKLPIFSVAGEPYNELLARIAMQAEVDIIVLGGMGLKYDDYLTFRNTLDEHGMEQIPSNRGYPGDLYSQLASRYEKAVDFETAGSITILAVTTMPGDDVTHPVPDNTGYITEGQFYLVNGRIEPFGSLSRLKQQVNSETRADHRALMDNMIRLYAEYKEALEKQSMGFKMSDWDSKLLKYGNLFEQRMMDLRVNIPLEEALDLGWKTLAECFTPAETGIKTDLVKQFWPKNS